MVDGWTKAATIAGVVTAVSAFGAVVVAALIARRQEKLSQRVFALEQARSEREEEEHRRRSSADLKIVIVEDPSSDNESFSFPIQVVNSGGAAAAGLILSMRGGDAELGRFGPFSLGPGAASTVNVQVRGGPLTRRHPASGWDYTGEGDFAAELHDAQGKLINRFEAPPGGDR
jgi:hypothetical protein